MGNTALATPDRRIHSVIDESTLENVKSGSAEDDEDAPSDSENVVSDENAVDKGKLVMLLHKERNIRGLIFFNV